MTDAEFRQIVITQRDRLFTFAAWSLGDPESAGDVAQDAFLRLWQKRRQVHSSAGRTWLFRATHRLCVDRHRQRARRCEMPLGAEDRRVDGACTGAVHEAQATETQRAVRGALARLPAQDRELLILREFTGMSIDDLARVLGRPGGNVKVALHRARQRLRLELEIMERSSAPRS